MQKTSTDVVAMDTEAFNALIIEAIEDVKGSRIAKLDLRALEEASADYYIICQGDSSTQVKAIADNITKRLKQESGVLPNHVEGAMGAKWILVDYFTTIVHVFYPETRTFYELEELWSDANITYYESL